ncbi:bifunctional acetate--CoA ligase family protein/GNAT family N-acetyltransferase [Teichococcus oryzae]|uniref:GNAT family N-acetyltransferase n=1 Tax=Teichococcus oryzae TaxID=1608942 RepID=A0A5B2TCA5_9PROT|nr:GNAT family N-acetyltransferase [Pseudoroseomonas oryzae]KAA2211478.1 GNAT family N-acetyltransferase [Pseudoroseomonas oryzae]
MELPLALPRRQSGFREAALFRPGSVVLVADPTLPEAALLAANLAAGGFQGSLHSVGLAAAGLQPAPCIAQLPEAPDLAVLCLPPEAQEPAMMDLAARGCFAAIVPVAAPDLAAMSERTGVRVLGAHSFGICLPAIGLNASLSHIAPRPGRLALLTQSSSLARTIIDWAAGEELGFSHIIGLGTNLGLGFALSLDWLARDAQAGAVLLDLRRIKNRRMFISAARATARTRPVVAIRPGGRQADLSGAANAVMEAALRRAGVLRVSGLEDLLSAAETLARLKPSQGRFQSTLAGDRLAIVANGQGPAQLAADAALQGGGHLAEWDEGVRESLALMLGQPAASLGNPLVLPPQRSHRLAEAASLLATVRGVDSVIVVHAPTIGQDSEATASAMAAATKANRGAPILVGWLGEAGAASAQRRLSENGIAVFSTPEAAIRGALHLAADRRNRAAAAELPARDVLELEPDRTEVGRIIDTARAEGRRDLNELEVLQILQAYGQAVVPGLPARSPAEAVKAAMQIGFPVVLKILSPDLPRKTEVGGVVLGIKDVSSLRATATHMLAQVKAARPDARLDGFLVQRLAGGTQRGHELRFHLGDDPMFGPWISYGRGGTASDFEPDVAYDLPPLNRTLALAMIRRTRGARLLEGFRDHPAIDTGLIVDTAVRLSQIAIDFPAIEDLIINPLLADAQGAMVLDASARLRPEGSVSLLAIPPYPAELARPWTARDGRQLMVRPIRPEDAAAHAEAFRSLAPEDVRWRFFNQLKEMPPAQIARMTQIDYDREMAFVAIEARPGETSRTAGVARLIREPGRNDGEFAVVTLPSWKGQGLGRHLMERLIEWARSQGLESITGQILADNRPMIGFVRALGFSITRPEADDDVVEARMALN